MGSNTEAEPGVHVLGERDGIVVAYKPADWATEPTAESSRSLVGALAAHFAVARVHAASRLDVGVSGAVLCSVGRGAHKQLEALRAQGAIRHCYLAVAAGALSGQGSWNWPLGRSRDRAGRAIARPDGPAARSASTHYEVLGQTREASLLRLRLETGRMHQIRAHAARAQAALLGDGRYGGPRTVCTSTGEVRAIERIALHCRRIELSGFLQAEAPIPELLRELWRLLDGQDDAWEHA